MNKNSKVFHSHFEIAASE